MDFFTDLRQVFWPKNVMFICITFIYSCWWDQNIVFYRKIYAFSWDNICGNPCISLLFNQLFFARKTGMDTSSLMDGYDLWCNKQNISFCNDRKIVVKKREYIIARRKKRTSFDRKKFHTFKEKIKNFIPQFIHRFWWYFVFFFITVYQIMGLFVKFIQFMAFCLPPK